MDLKDFKSGTFAQQRQYKSFILSLLNGPCPDVLSEARFEPGRAEGLSATPLGVPKRPRPEGEPSHLGGWLSEQLRLDSRCRFM